MREILHTTDITNTPSRRARPRRLRTVLLAITTLALVALPALGQTAAAAPTEKFSYTASAFGTSVTVGSAVRSGQSALVGLGCTTEGGLVRSNRTAGSSLAPLGSVGAVKTLVESFATPVRARGTAITGDVNLLGGLVRATAIRAQSTTTRTSTGALQLSANGTTLTGLVVAGQDVAANAAPNTRINLAGIGYVIINEQIRRTNGITVNGLHIVVNDIEVLGSTQLGANIIVSQAVSGLSAPVAGVVGGSAYGSYATVGSAALSGPTFKASLPCLGTNGVVKTNSGAGVTIPVVGSTGTVTNTVKGTVTATSASGEAVSTVQAANLLDGLVEASAIKASAKASTDGGTVTLTDEGSGFGTLSVEGLSNIDADVAPNTKVRISGVGTLYLHRVIKSEAAVTVIMIQFILSNPVDGLDVGTDIRVAVANASVG